MVGERDVDHIDQLAFAIARMSMPAMFAVLFYLLFVSPITLFIASGSPIATAASAATFAFAVTFAYVIWPYSVHIRLSHIYALKVDRGRLTEVLLIIGVVVFVATTSFVFAVAPRVPSESEAMERLDVVSAASVLVFFAMMFFSFGLAMTTLVGLEKRAGHGPGAFLTLIQLFYLPLGLGFLKKRIDRLEAAAPKR